MDNHFLLCTNSTRFGLKWNFEASCKTFSWCPIPLSYNITEEITWKHVNGNCKLLSPQPSAFLHIISLFFIILFPFLFQIRHPCVTLWSQTPLQKFTQPHSEECSSSNKESLLLLLATEKNWEQSSRPPSNRLDNDRWVQESCQNMLREEYIHININICVYPVYKTLQAASCFIIKLFS